jgi:hypothetical protein
MFDKIWLPLICMLLVSIISFLLIEGAWDQAQTWASLTAAQRTSYKSQYAAAGIKMLVSAFGSTDGEHAEFLGDQTNS